ncbi:hypothetical protein ES702_01412 [subsurface metagenome]
MVYVLSRRRGAPRRTERERRITHEALYGRGARLPARRYRFAPQAVTPQQISLQIDWTPILLIGGGLVLIWLMGRK